MPSLAILEGLISTACAVTCLYYARLGALAAPQNAVQTMVPWHSALGEYARRNPFAVVFGALALGFLVSSWSMYALPRPVNAEPRAIEKWHTITKNVPTPDPAQAAKIATLETTLNADAATIAAQTAELDRLKQVIGKSPRRSRRSSTMIGANPADANANPEGTAADLNKTFNPANAAAGTAAPASSPQPAATQNATVPGNGPPAQSPAAPTPNPASQTPASTPPH